jgi:hypothetical protein
MSVKVKLACIASLVIMVSSLFLLAGQRSPNRFSRIQASRDVPWLEHLALSEDFARDELNDTGFMPKEARIDAYERLGTMGTQESLDSVKRIEAAMRDRPMLDEMVSFEAPWPHPALHMSDAKWKPTIVEISPGKNYGVIIADFLGAYSPFLP